MRRSKINSILYVYLPLGGKVKIFPSGIAYLASYVKNISPTIRQLIVDLSIIDKKDRKKVLMRVIRDFRPDLLAFSWRHIRYFGPDLYNDDLKEMNYGPKKNIRCLISFVAEGFSRWKEYAISIVENLQYIKLACDSALGTSVLVGGSGFSVFHKDLLKKMPKEVIGIIGDGEPFLADLIEGKSVLISDRLREKRLMDVRNEIKAVDYDYIVSIYSGYENYFNETIGVQTNRGCDQRCVFCPDTARDRSMIFSRDPSEVVEEISRVKKVFKTKKIWFADRLVVSKGNVADFSRILEEILKRPLDIRWSGYMRPDVFTPDLARLIVKSGLQDFIVPITSGSQRVVDLLKLGFNIEEMLHGCRLLKEAGYDGSVSVECTLGVVEESREDIKKTMAIYHAIKDIFGKDHVKLILNFCIVLPGSELEKRLLETGYFHEGYDSVSFDPFMIRKFAYMTPSMRKVFKKAYTYSDAQSSLTGASREELVLDYLIRHYH